MQLDRLSKITGMSRKQAAEALREQMNDKRVQALLAAVDPMVKENLENTFVALGNVGPAFKDGITELVATGGVPMSEMGESIAAMMPEVVQASKDLASGAIDQDQFTTILQESQKKAQARLEAEGQNIATQKTMGVTLFDSILDLAKAGKIAGQDAEARKQQLEAQKISRMRCLTLNKQYKTLEIKSSSHYLTVKYLISLRTLWVNYRKNSLHS